MLISQQQKTLASTSGALNSPGPAANPNEKVTRNDISPENFFDQLVLPVISDSKAIEAIRAVLADQTKRGDKFPSIPPESNSERITQAVQLLDQLERTKTIPLNHDTLDLVRGFYTVAFRPIGNPLMSDSNQAALRSAIEGSNLPTKLASDWERFKNFPTANRPPLRGFTEGTLILFAISARCYGAREPGK